jgi:prepilin-type N-terminal cleavage/methylation domain-containing protein
LGIKAFTLIEMLVVVLIIGILAAIAFPQYQVAVAKSQLARFMSIVKTLAYAEERHFLTTGDYAADLDQLDVDIPVTPDCVRMSISRYTCGDISFQVADNISNVQAGNNRNRYLHVFKDYTHPNLIMRKGDRFCFAKLDDEVANKACTAIGGVNTGRGSWDYYKL